jgi:putative ABC transport system permease protein
MIPFSYSVRSLIRRPLTVVVTLTGLAAVVLVFTAVLMLSSGIKETLASSGSPDNFIVLRDGATSEAVSGISRDQVRLFSAESELAKAPNGQPLIDAELALIGGFDRVGGAGRANVAIRGVGPLALQIRPTVKVIEGKVPGAGTSEIMIGKGIVGRYEGFHLGDHLTFARRDWNVVGIFSAEGASFESEIWGDVDQLSDAFSRVSAYSEIVGRTAQADQLTALGARLASDPQLSTVTVQREDKFFDTQSASTRTFVTVLGMFVAIIFAVAAALGAAITMYAQVASRVREVGTLRAIGFKRRVVLGVFLRESVLLSLTGGAIGLAVASLGSLVTFSLTNNNTFTDITFHFKFGPNIVVAAAIFALVLGVLGGFLPALRASRLSIVSATRG